MNLKPSPTRYLVMIRRTGTGYCADVPDLPGCIAAESSIERVRKLMAEAIGLHIDLMRESGELIPEPTSRTDFSDDDSDGEEFCTWVTIKSPTALTKRRLRRNAKQRVRTP